jgi:subtilisin family serine protease
MNLLTKIDSDNLISKSKNRNVSNMLFFKDQNDNTVGVTDEIIVGYNDVFVKNDIELRYDLKLLKTLNSNTFLYQLSNKNLSLDISNKLYELKSIKFAHPNFIKKRKKRNYGPLFDKSWHLKNTGDNTIYEDLKKGADINVVSAWGIAKGEGVKVGIIDDAIDIKHEDLKENIVEYRNYADPNTDDPSPIARAGNEEGDWHGTACSGLIVAQENSKGSIGVSPKSKLYPVKYADDDASTIEAFYWLNSKGVDVISNSWGSYDIPDALSDTLKDLSKNGRDGKGVVILFASGNDRKDLDEYGINDESESPYVISIGATSGIDKVTSYSNYGSALDFVAPGGEEMSILTTDVTGSKGYEDGKYTDTFSGTSASTPIAAGVVALVLSANPNLTKNEVVKVLKDTADKIGNKRYTDGRNDHYGYGRLNAGKAVARAKEILNSTLYPPSSLRFTNVTSTSVTLNWKDNSVIESGFKIFRDGELIHTTKKNETSFTDRDLNSQTKYKYTIKATDD